jgi:diguanylate cyclase (GGDEF)-like protein
LRALIVLFNATELLLLMTSLQTFLFAVGWLVAYVTLRRDRSIMRGFFVFNVCIGIAFTMIALRSNSPDALERTVPNLLILAGMFALTYALHAANGLRVVRWWVAPALIAAIAVVWFGAIDRNDSFRVFALLAGFFWLLVLCVLRTHQPTRQEFGSIAANALTFVALVTLLTISWRTYMAFASEVTIDLNRPSRYSNLGILVMLLAVNGPNLLYGYFMALRLVRRANEVASRDGLTDLLNHRAFMETATKSWERRRGAREPAAVLAIDLDHFKRINDEHGHQTGDEVLRAFAKILRGASDKRCIVGRTGGEEFTVVIERANREIASSFAQRIRRRVARAHWGNAEDAAIQLTVSIGIAIDAPRDMRANDVLARADRALYAAKAEGRDRISFA